MEKVTKDYHGWKLEDALKDLERLVMLHKGDKEVEVMAITGLGVINDEFKKYLTSVEPFLNISWSVPMYNEGNVLIILEKI